MLDKYKDSACVIILAGGKGTRIKDIHPDVPKPMIEVYGQPFIEWVIEYFKEQGINNFVVSLGHLSHIAQNYFNNRRSDGTYLKAIIETSALGTGGAIYFAQQSVEQFDPIIVTNGDSIVLADLQEMWNLISKEDIDGVILGIQMDDTSRYGTMEVGSDGLLRGFREKRPGRGVVNAGVYFLKRKLFNSFPKIPQFSIESDVFPNLLMNNCKIAVTVCSGPFIDIGTPESLSQAEEFIFNNIIMGIRSDKT